jgi:hypothetical protein
MIALCHTAPNLIQHAWGRINGVFDPHVGEAPSFPPGRGLEEINPKAAILHRNKDGTLIDRMREGTVKRAVAPTGGPRMAIFIRTFKNDAQWLVYCLRSIKKFCTGYSEVVLACPKEDMAVIQQVVAPYRHRVVPVENDPAKGYLEQQVTKLCADQFTDAEYILMTDSDCLFIVPNTPLSWFTNGRIVHLITPWAALEGGGAMVWRKPTEAALGYPCEYETMRRHPFVFPRSVIANCRKWIENRHRKPIREYVLSTGGFSEFNSLASYAMSREPQWFTFVNTTNNPLPPEIVKQFWSWGGITPEVKHRMDAILV